MNRSGELVSTGIQGLDDVLGGGLTANRLYLVEGVPGSGKTTLALQFLLEGVRSGEPVLYVSLSESGEETASVAASHGWSMEGVTAREISQAAQLHAEDQYTMFHPSEVELGETMRSILDDVRRIQPRRVAFDSLSELRLLAGNALRYRRQILGLKHFFAGRQCTVLLLDDMTSHDHDLQVQSIAHGVIVLEQLNPDYGADRRRLRVSKYRGRKFRGGYHDYAIRRGGLEVFPRLVASEHRPPRVQEKMASDIPALDALLGGGLERGTSTLFAGAAGTGKSTLAARFAYAAAERGQNSAIFVFDEGVHTLTSRAEAVGMPLNGHVESGRVLLQQVDPAEMSPGELTSQVRRCVEDRDVALVVIDSLNGFLNAMPGERHLIVQLHELLTYLGQCGVATIMISAHQGLIGNAMIAPVDASYLADAVLLLRYYETDGEVRQAISVVKKRGSAHERTIRRFELRSEGIVVGDPLRGYRGVLTGVPTQDDPQRTAR